MRRILKIALHQWSASLKDRIFLALTFIMLLLFGCSMLVSSQAHSRAVAEMAALQEVVDEQWRNQPDRHPHRVAHYGYLVFRTPSPLAFFDFGVSDYAGNSVFLEAHVQNSANFSEARQDSSLLRMGALTPAFILQTLLPLLVIFLLGDCVTRERERGTLAQIMSLGLPWRTFLFGKVTGGVLVFGTLLFPFLTAGILATVKLGGAGFEDILLRLIMLLAVYFAYLALWVMLSVIVSARSRSSGKSVAVLLALWILTTTFLPKALPSLGAFLNPAPSRPEMEHAIHTEVVGQGHGHAPNDAQFEAEKERLLKKYQVDSVEDLPFNWRGVAMKEGERASTEIYKRSFDELYSIYDAQNRTLEYGSIVSPYVATKKLSAAICGTDFHAAVLFENQAEEFRFQTIQKLNDIHINEISYEGDKEQRVSSDHWEEFEQFRLTRPSLFEDLTRSKAVLAGLLVQFFLLGLFLYFTPARIR